MNCLFCGQPLIPGENQCRSCGRLINSYQPGQQTTGAAQPSGTSVQSQGGTYGTGAQVPPVQQPVRPQAGAAGYGAGTSAQPPRTPQVGAAGYGAGTPAQPPRTPQVGAAGYNAGAAGYNAQPQQPVRPQQSAQPPRTPQAGATGYSAGTPAQPPRTPQAGAAGYSAGTPAQPPRTPQAGAAGYSAGTPAQPPRTPGQPGTPVNNVRPAYQPSNGQTAAKPAMTFNQQQSNVQRPVSPQAGAQNRGTQPPSGGKGKGKLIAIISAVTVLVAGIILGIVLLTKDKDEDKGVTKVGGNDRTTAATTQVTTETPTTSATTETPTTEVTTEATTANTTEATTEGTTQQASGSKTVMMYVIGSNLETEWGEATVDIQEILDANLSSNVNYIIQTGGSKQWMNDQMKDGECQRFKVQGQQLVELQQLGKVNMVDYNNLTDFINYCKTNYPADSYMLVLWDHGGGIPISYGMDEIYPGKMMTAAEIGMAIQSSGVHFETLLFDACNVCTLEAAVSVYNYVDYMVAAESYVNGTGYYYTDWLKMYDSCRIGDVDYTEQICKDYMKVIHMYDMTGSISVLEMDKIPDVYEAYKNYIGALNNTVINGNDYVAYTQARNNCISYEYTDTIDIITLANQYENDYSTKLINSIVNSVSYTESDFSAGHGIAVYSPFEYIEEYTTARNMLTQLGYDNSIINFYDSYCSLRSAYQGGEAGSDPSSQEWYDDDTVNETVDPNNVGQEITLSTSTNSSGQTIVDVPDELWETYETIELGVILMSDDGNEGLMLGTDFYSDFDADYNLLVTKPDSWAYLNGAPAAYVGLSSYDDPEDSTKWEMYGTIIAKVNGQSSLILVYYSQDYPTGIVQGYANVDFDNMTKTSEFYQFQDTDTIDLVYPVFNADGTSRYTDNGQEFKYSDLKLTYEPIDLSGYNTVVWYTIKDVYGNVYETDAILAE